MGPGLRCGDDKTRRVVDLRSRGEAKDGEGGGGGGGRKDMVHMGGGGGEGGEGEGEDGECGGASEKCRGWLHDASGGDGENEVRLRGRDRISVLGQDVSASSQDDASRYGDGDGVETGDCELETDHIRDKNSVCIHHRSL